MKIWQILCWWNWKLNLRKKFLLLVLNYLLIGYTFDFEIKNYKPQFDDFEIVENLIISMMMKLQTNFPKQNIHISFKFATVCFCHDFQSKNCKNKYVINNSLCNLCLINSVSLLVILLLKYWTCMSFDNQYFSIFNCDGTRLNTLSRFVFLYVEN